MMRSHIELFVGVFLLPISCSPCFAQPVAPCLNSTASKQTDCSKAIAGALSATTRSTALPEGWTLVRSKSEPGPEQISIMRPTDVDRSDFGLAGLSLVCTPDGITPLVILLEPVPLGTRPSVSITVDDKESVFDALVLPGQRSLRISLQMAPAPPRDWLQSKVLSVKVVLGSKVVQGVLPLSGLQGAFATLQSTCMR